MRGPAHRNAHASDDLSGKFTDAVDRRRQFSDLSTAARVATFLHLSSRESGYAAIGRLGEIE
jgi:hypothetical protein